MGAWAGSDWRRSCLEGAPLSFLPNLGLLFAPAAHAGALFPGVMPLMVAVLATAVLGEAFTATKKAGFALILSGALGIAWSADGAIGWQQSIGHALFSGSALAWACYTVAMRRARLDGLHAAAIAAVGALLLYMPVILPLRRRSEPGRGPLGRHCASSVRAGPPDSHHLPHSLRARGQHSGRFQWCRVRGSVSGDDRIDGHPHSRGVADGD